MSSTIKLKCVILEYLFNEFLLTSPSGARGRLSIISFLPFQLKTNPRIRRREVLTFLVLELTNLKRKTLVRQAETRRCPICGERIPLRLLSKHAELESERVENILDTVGSSEVFYDKLDYE